MTSVGTAESRSRSSESGRVRSASAVHAMPAGGWASMISRTVSTSSGRLGGVGRGLGVDEHEPADPLRREPQHGHREVAAHRAAAEHDAVEVQPVEQGDDVPRGVLEARFAVGLRQRRAAEPALVRSDHPKV
jgi:hypothetical protein